MNKFTILAVSLFIILFSGCSLNFHRSKRVNNYKAAIIVVIDQLSTESFRQYKSEFGFKELSKRNSFFMLNANYPYLFPETCPGHATISTGTYPWKHGIIANSWKDKNEQVEKYCVEDSNHEVSPISLMQPTITDIINKLGFPTYSISVSGKDRAAVMLAGKSANQVLWYNKENGKFQTSSYFPKASDIVKNFNDQKLWERYYYSPWEISAEYSIPYGYNFDKGQELFETIYNGPALDALTYNLFKKLLVANNRNDLFHIYSLSLSSPDIIGHRYGSLSIEYMSALKQADIYLYDLIQILDIKYGANNYLLAVTSDHGSFPIENKNYQRVSAEAVSCSRSLNKNCKELDELICFDKLNPHSGWYQYAKHSYYHNRGPDCHQIYSKEYLPQLPPGTSHLTPWSYDTQVPLWIYGSDLVFENKNQISPASIVPTFLKALQIKSDSNFDDHSLVE
jgi:predicted AlkP superfamily pyrophosphatase or phosphodiesterase